MVNVMRTFFLPGFGEEPWIFDQIAPQIGGQHVFIRHRDLMGDRLREAYDVQQYAQALIETHHITPQDRLIGHSMGGWIAYSVKQLTGSPIVQIGSWTDPDKVVLLVKEPNTVYWLVRNGLYLNHFNKWYFSWRSYRGQPSRRVFEPVFQHLIDSPPGYVLNQLQVILTPVQWASPQAPDLRIHAQADTIVRPPDEPFAEVPGDHFCLVTEAEPIAAAVSRVLAHP
jgi:pimeloyl-ACP methyl ester carboxylesterase